jgi:hypothetical protein
MSVIGVERKTSVRGQAVAVAAIVVAGASVVVVAPAEEVAGASGPAAASIILVANQTDLVDVEDFREPIVVALSGAAEAGRKRAARHRMRPDINEVFDMRTYYGNPEAIGGLRSIDGPRRSASKFSGRCRDLSY